MSTAEPDIDSYIDPATGTLRNLLGARTDEELHQLESNVTAAALYRLNLNPVAGSYDLDHLCAIHAELFKDVYPWAGRIRTVEIAKGEPFRLAETIVETSNALFNHLAAEDHLRGLDLYSFTDHVSAYYAALNHIHPFREGNGRTQRAFLSQLARDAGYDILWERLDSRVNVAACREAIHNDLEPLQVAFTD